MKCYACHGKGGRLMWDGNSYRHVWVRCSVCAGKGRTK